MKIQLETGNVLEFPDDAGEEEIQVGITHFLGSQPVPAPEKGFMSSVGDFFTPPTQAEAGKSLDQYKAGLVNAASYASAGAPDELMARVTAAGTLPITGAIDVANRMGADIPNPMAGKSWDEIVNAETMRNRAQNKEALKGMSTETNIVSGVIGTAINPLSRLFPSSMAAQGALVSGFQGFGEGEGGFSNRVANALPQAVIGGALGAAGDVAVKAGGAALNYLGKKVNPPAALEKITEYRKKAYKYIEDSDFEINPEDMTKMGQRIADRVLPKKPQELELLKANNPAVIAKLGQFEKTMSATPTSLKATRMYDAGLNDAITESIKLGNKSTTDTKYLYDLQDEFRAAIDEAAEGLPPAARDANFLNTQERKITDVYRILENASYTQNPSTHVQTQFSRILDKGRGWSDQDKAVIRLILKEDLGDETLRTIGSRLSSIGQLAQGNIGTSLLQTGISSLSRSAKDARKLAKVDRLITQIGRESAKRIKQMEYINAPKPPAAAPVPAAPEPQKLLPAPQKFTQYGNPDNATPRVPTAGGTINAPAPTAQKLLPSPNSPTGEMAVTRSGQAMPMTGTQSAEAAAMRQRAFDLGLTPDVRKVAESFSRRTKEAPAWNAITKEQQDKILTQIDDAWKQYDKGNKPSINRMIREAELKARQIAKAKGENYSPTVLGEKLREAVPKKTSDVIKSGKKTINADEPIQKYQNYTGRPLPITSREPLKITIRPDRKK